MICLEGSPAVVWSSWIWRQRLLQVMLDIGVPTCFVRWISEFLSDCRAFTTVGNTRSRIRVMREGLRRGSVLAPILFLFHINNLAGTLPDDVLVSLFADDLAALVQHEEKAKAEVKVQEVLRPGQERHDQC